LSRSKKSRAGRDDADATYSTSPGIGKFGRRAASFLGADPWKFGIKGNEKALNALIRYAEEQGLLAKKMTVADLFVHSRRTAVIDEELNPHGITTHEHHGHGDQRARSRGRRRAAHAFNQRRHRYRLFDFPSDVLPAADRLSVRLAAKTDCPQTQM